VSVTNGATLTIQPGVIVKFSSGLITLNVNGGKLSAVGTAANPIYFTSIADDSIGGDTGGDGPTSGSPGAYCGLAFGNSANVVGQTSTLTYVTLRYAGKTSCGSADINMTTTSGNPGPVLSVHNSTISNSAGIGALVSGATLNIEDSSVDHNATDGVKVTGTNGVAAVSRTTITSNTGKGLNVNTLTSGSPATSVFDSTITGNGIGVYTLLSTSLTSASWPYGHRNNIYANGGASPDENQLFDTNASPRGNWTNNYWGSDVDFRPNYAECGTPVGYLAYRSSTYPDQVGPLRHGAQWSVFHPAPTGSTHCFKDKTFIGKTEFQQFPFDQSLSVPSGQAIGCVIDGEFAENPSAACKQDPVNTATGSLDHEVTDLTLPGIGVSFSFVRSYHSGDSAGGPFGTGWTHSYNASLTFWPGDVVARAGSGQQLDFVKDPDGSFTANDGGRATLATVTGGYELVTNDQLHYRFDTSGKLTSLKDRNDKGLTFTYDGSGRLSTITDAASRQVTLSYDGSGLLTQLSAPGSRTVSYGYTNGQLTSVTAADGKVWTYTYESHGLLEKEIDPLSHTVFRNVYGADGRVTEQYDALNNKTTFAWDDATQTATITDPRNNMWKDAYSNNILESEIDANSKTTQYTHDDDLNDSSVTGPDGSTTSLTYDARGNLTHAVAPASLNADKTLVYDSMNNVTSVTDARGKVTTYGYDGSGNNTTITQDGVTVATYTYNSAGQITTFKDGRNNETTYTYDTNGNVGSETDALGDKTTYSYDAAGRMTLKVDPRGNVQGADPNDYKTIYTYDGAGRTLTETDPLGHVTTYAYDDAGNQTSVTDPDNHATSYSYDADGRVLTETAANGGVTTYTYDAAGNKLTEKNPNNKTTTYTYDADNRLASDTTPLGNKTTYSYDSSGNLSKQVDPRGNVQGANPDDYATTYTYDAAGRMLTETDALGHTTTYTYDKVGNRATLEDANNHTATYAYNGRNLLTSVTAPGGAETTYAYDNAGNLTSRTDPKTHQTTYTYDAANQVTNMTLPLSRQWTYVYDAAGNRTQVVDANGNSTQTAGDGTTTYSYDRAGRLTGIDHSDSTPDVTYSYDGAGNRTEMTDGSTQTSTYNNVNRLTQVTRGTDTFAYTYDLAGNITQRTYPDSTVVDYTYDDDSRLATVATSSQTTTYGYDASGNLTQTTLPSSNGYVEDRTYDRAGRLTRVKTSKTGSTLADFTYTLDPVGNPTQVVRDGSLPETTTYSYDARDRLTDACFQTSCSGASDPFIRWTYDSVGNRLTETRPAGTTIYTYNAADELTSAGSTNYSYDDNGNETAAGSQSFTYDLANRMLTSATGGITTTYSYDGDGNRTQAVGSATTKYLWDTNGRLPQVVLERTGSNASLRTYVYGKSRISMTAGGVHYYAYDALGSIANVSSSTGTAEWTYAYEPFGATSTETQSDPNAPPNPMKFAGEFLDQAGFYDLRAREYDTNTGRFQQRDIVTQTTQPYVSTYAYVGDQPTVLADPTGQYFEPASDGQDSAASTTSPDPAAYLSAEPPPGYFNCGHAECDGINPKSGWDIVRGSIKAPKRAAVVYWVRLSSLAALSWAGRFNISGAEIKHLWVPVKGIWVPSPVLIGAGVTKQIGYKVMIENYNPHGQTWEILVQVRAPYRCTAPDPRGFEP
jgi:RHS repeat-associated protein